MFDFLHLNEIYCWGLAGFLLILIEMVLGWPTTVLFIGGLASMTVSTILAINSLSIEPYYFSTSAKIVLFLLSACLWFLLCWKWIKNFLTGSKNKVIYKNVIGRSAVIYGKDLKPGEFGEIKWSGAVCKACIEEQYEKDGEIKLGSVVDIVEVKSNIFFVKPSNREGN